MHVLVTSRGTLDRLEITVYGKPRPQGSKRPVRHPHTDKIVLIDSSNKDGGLEAWRISIRMQAIAALNRARVRGRLPYACMTTIFMLPRPKSQAHLEWPSIKPDLDKLVRACFDALTGVVYEDDDDVIVQRSMKIFSQTPGVKIVVTPMDASVEQDMLAYCNGP